MAMKTTHLISLLALGFIILLLGGPWWLGIGVVILAMAVAVTGEEAPVRAPEPVITAQPAQPLVPEEEPYFDDWGSVDPNWKFPSINDMNLQISSPPDTIGDMTAFKSPDGVCSTGFRSGTLTLDPNDIIRFKDDFRIKLDGMDKASGISDVATMGWDKGATTYRVYYRTGSDKRVWPYRTALQWEKPPPKKPQPPQYQQKPPPPDQR